MAFFHRDTLASVQAQYEDDLQQGTPGPGPRGLLLGVPPSGSGEPVVIESLKVAAGATVPERRANLMKFAQFWSGSAISRVSLAGFYQILTPAEQVPAETDWELMRSLAPAEYGLLLTYEQEATRQYPFRVYDLTSRQLLGELAWEPEGSAIVPAQPAMAAPREVVWNRKSLLMGAGILGAIVLLVALFLTGRRTTLVGEQRPLGLQVTTDRADGYWKVSWQRDGKAVRSAVSGKLHLSDGVQSRDIILDSAELRHGDVMFKPLSNSVTLRLEVTTPDHQTLAESSRFLAGGVPQDGVTQPAARTAARQLPGYPGKRMPAQRPHYE